MDIDHRVDRVITNLLPWSLPSYNTTTTRKKHTLLRDKLSHHLTDPSCLASKDENTFHRSFDLLCGGFLGHGCYLVYVGGYYDVVWHRGGYQVGEATCTGAVGNGIIRKDLTRSQAKKKDGFQMPIVESIKQS
jgi:hypothetical protein